MLPVAQPSLAAAVHPEPPVAVNSAFSATASVLRPPPHELRPSELRPPSCARANAESIASTAARRIPRMRAPIQSDDGGHLYFVPAPGGRTRGPGRARLLLRQ